MADVKRAGVERGLRLRVGQDDRPGRDRRQQLHIGIAADDSGSADEQDDAVDADDDSTAGPDGALPSDPAEDKDGGMGKKSKMDKDDD